MDIHKKRGNPIQVCDALFETFPNQRQLLNITYYGRSSDIHNQNLYGLHTHLYTEIFACGKGSVTISIPPHSYTLKAGDVAVIPSGIMHTKTHGGTSSGTLWVTAGVLCTRCRTVGEVGTFARAASVLDSDTVSVFSTNTPFYEIIKNVVHCDPKDIRRTDLIRFATELCLLVSDGEQVSDPASGGRRISKPDIDRLVNLEILINSRYNANISNKEFADALFLSERQLSRFVNRYYGVPLHTLINNKRVETAAAMLKSTDDSVSDIAEAVGFNGKTGFYREFQKLYGITPLQYRKENKK